MGRSNRTAALESKIMFLMGEHETKLLEIAKAEKIVEELPMMRERLWEIETLISACETVIKSDQPAWTRDHLKPMKAFVHKIPVLLGNASKHALDVLRLADQPMTCRQVAIEVLAREGHDNPDTETDVRGDVSGIPLYHFAALLLAREASKQGVTFERLGTILPSVAGAAYIEFQLAEIRAGRCDQRGGTSNLNNRLWALLRSDQARKVLEEKLPGGRLRTKRYACFTETEAFACDDLNDLQQPRNSLRVVDAWSVASQMQGGLRGTFLATYIA